MRCSIIPDSLGELRFSGCWPKSVFSNGERTEEQKTNAKGVPLWSVGVDAFQRGQSRPEQMRFEVAAKTNPCDDMERGDRIAFDAVELRWFVFTKEGNKLVQTFAAEGVQAVTA